jgi:hypothetical protein
MLRSFHNARGELTIQPARYKQAVFHRMARAIPRVLSVLLLLLATAIMLVAFYWVLFWGPKHLSQAKPHSDLTPSIQICRIRLLVRG